MRIAVFGTGGAGGRFGAYLARAGEEVVFIARGDHLKAIQADGLRLQAQEDEFLIHPAQATDEPRQVGPVDLVLLGVKTWQVEDAAAAMKPLMGDETFVLPLQNGIEAAGQLSEVLGEHRVIGGLCATLSWIDSPGVIRSLGETHFVRFGELDNSGSLRTERLFQAFKRAGVEADIPPDIHVALWEKFLFVVSLGGVGAVTRAPIGVVRSMPATRRMLERCMSEIHAVGQARSVALEDGITQKTLEFVDTLDPAGTTSLQRDIMEGRPSELEAWNGAVVRIGAASGVPTPTHEVLYQSLLPMEMRARGQVSFP